MKKTLIAALAASLLAVPSADAAKRKVPATFSGVQLDGGAETDPPAVQEAQFALMARSGVESARIVFSWRDMQPQKNGAFDFTRTDAQVGAAARHGIVVLPVMLYAPDWARAFPRDGGSPPLTAPYQGFLRATIRRYGTGGSYWRENPAVPRRTIRYWQVWNEPHFEGFWDAPAKSRYSYPRGYARLLSASNKTIHATDRRARTVTAGLFGAAWERLADLYRSGGVRKSFDVAAVHVYSNKPGNVLETVKRTNATMRRYKDGGNRVWVTETSFPASKGQARPIRNQKQDTPASMARKLTDTYVLLARNAKKQRIDRVYWYTWASSYQQTQPSNFDYAGLLKRTGPFSYTPQPALDSFRRVSQRLQGCAKTDAGACR
ncbi:MAG TPA: hypothetical protein VFY44_01110 [Thermoleophilaceae bacterium]|nr:hypothetical protein [Thermoleophilaceae bacterium]